MIPKKIHYCWFGGKEKPALAQKCIESWKKYCPDYEIIEWNEDNFDVNICAYTQYHFQNKKFAFLSDYVRLCVIYQHGGFYFDTDVELKKNIDFLLSYDAVFGFENQQYINTGQGFGAVAQHDTICAMKKCYENLIPDSSGAFTVDACPTYNTDALLPFGIQLNGTTQQLNNIMIFSPEYMNPFDNAKGTLNQTENTFSIHWYSKSWLSPKQKLILQFTRPFHRLFGDNCFQWLKR